MVEMRSASSITKTYFTTMVPDYNSSLVHVTRKQTLRSLSLSYQKKDGQAWLCPSFFWHDTDFLEFESFDFIDHIL